MTRVDRLTMELGQLQQILRPQDFAAYLWLLVQRAPSILKAATLAPADAGMTAPVKVQAGDVTVSVPCGAIATILGDRDLTPTFGGLREIFGARVYLRAFRPDLVADVAVDLGANRGLFMLQAAAALKAKRVFGVEAQAMYTPAFEAIRAANPHLTANFERIEKFVGPTPGPPFITLMDLMKDRSIERIGFLKCDIEGAEFPLLAQAPEFLAHVDNVAMEIHVPKGDPEIVRAALDRFGFEVAPCDQFGRRCALQQAEYLYASKTGALTVA